MLYLADQTNTQVFGEGREAQSVAEKRRRS